MGKTDFSVRKAAPGHRYAFPNLVDTWLKQTTAATVGRALGFLALELSLALLFTAAPVFAHDIATERLIARVLEARQIRGARGIAQLIREDLEHGTSRSRRLVITSATRERTTMVLYLARATAATSGSAVLITLAPGRTAGGYIFNGPETVLPLTPALFEQPFFTTDLTIGDLTDDFLAWPSQRQIGSERVRGRDCVIIESLPSPRTQSPIARVRSWIAPAIALPLKIEKYDAAGALQRRFIVKRVSRLDDQSWCAAVLAVTGVGGRTRTTLKMLRGDRHAEVKMSEFEIESIRRFLLSGPAAAAPKTRKPR
ncbi:MAG: outer membrane lipoprotein-sorting protein [Candidatus Aminicenantes bacterium]|nr:outer membrane lipoprotein-sorting protein [Candidatus Aminicenantes bacterium]